MSTWKIEQFGQKPKLRNPIFIEGMPGIGNVGKVAIDFLIDELGAKKIYEMSSYSFPYAVFVNEDNLVELPTIELYYKKGKKDILILTGDVQPIDEESSYEFSEKVLDIVQKYKCKEIVTLGGIGLRELPKKPKVYCTGNSKKLITKYKKMKVDDKVYGVVGPIMGVSGLLLGLAKKRKIDAITLLAETFGHPMYVGIDGAKEILNILGKTLGVKFDLKKLDKEIAEIKEDMLKRTEEIQEVTKQSALKKIKGKLGEEASYIG